MPSFLCLEQCTSNVRALTAYQELDVFHQIKVPCIHPEVLHHSGVVQIVRIMVRERVVAEGCHLLGSVGGQRLINSSPSIFRCLLQEKKKKISWLLVLRNTANNVLVMI